MQEDQKKISLGLSPCPNDTFIFHALLHGLCKNSAGAPLEFSPLFADVERLNALAMSGELEITKISLGVMPYISEKYALLSSGAALGWGCGPLVVARKPLEISQIKNAVIAIPGQKTTANLLLDLHGGFQGERVEMIFSDIIPAVASGKVDAGVIIHEGRFTYAAHGLAKILDLGEWWEGEFKMPLPLGAIAARRDVQPEIVRTVEEAIRASVEFAWQNPQASKDFIKKHAQEMDDEVINRHIATFVTDYSASLQDQGKRAIQTLLNRAPVKAGTASLFFNG